MPSKILMVSFDLIRQNDPPKSFAIASLLASLKNNEQIKAKYVFSHLSINVLYRKADWQSTIKSYNLRKYSFIAVSAYIWNEIYTNDLLKYLRENKFTGKIILGGYQITNSSDSDLKLKYPLADFFVKGFAEQQLAEILLGKKCEQINIAAVYLNGEIKVKENMEMLRFETKRGCPYSCSFCRHRDIFGQKIAEHDYEKILSELDYLLSMKVKKINIIDPIFHIGKNYLKILRYIVAKKTSTVFSLQCRLEYIATDSGRKFLELCEQGNFILEFGLQTLNEKESKLINRQNKFSHIKTALNMLNESSIKYEISLIHGLPSQTLKSFSQGLEFLKKHCKGNVKTYPLMLLPGTPLYSEKDKWAFKEELNELGIPIVVESSSFSRNELSGKLFSQQI